MIAAAVRRTLTVGLGFVLSIIAGLITLFLLGSRWAASEVSAYAPEHPDEISRLLNDFLAITAFFFTVAPVLTLLPALAAAVIGEVARIRSPLYYLVAGGAAAALMPIIATRMGEVEGATYASPYFTIMATAGFAAGLVYWLIAGRNA